MLILHLWRDQRLTQSFPMHRCIFAVQGKSVGDKLPQIEIGLGVAAKRRNIPADMKRTLKKNRIVLSQGWFLRLTWGWPIWSECRGRDIPITLKREVLEGHDYISFSLWRLWIEVAY